MNRQLPLFPKGSIQKDGRRTFVHPADVSGRFTTRRYVAFAALIAIYVVLPWVKIGGAPAVFLDIQHRRFYLFGGTFNAQDTWLLFFLITALAFSLIFLTAVLGRIWCGYACPQTVFLEGVFRRVERFIEGRREKRIQLARARWSVGKIARKGSKHAVYIVTSLLIAHVFLSYFVSLPDLFEMVRKDPAEHPEAFAWALGITAVVYLNFSWFREQLCLVVCPYGRLQSVLTDSDSIVVGYDPARGEPRGKAKDPNAGDCVDCGRCVVVCPTAIDIRNGLQIECVGCAACVDACDEIMGKLGRDRGLVRYDSLAGLEGGRRRFWRPRVYLYGVLGAVGLTVAVVSASGRQAFEANVLRQKGPPFVIDQGVVRNALEIHIVNKQPEEDSFKLTPAEPAGVEVVLPSREIRVKSLRDARVPLFVTVPKGSVPRGFEVQVAIESGNGERKTVTAPFLAPGRSGGKP